MPHLNGSKPVTSLFISYLCKYTHIPYIFVNNYVKSQFAPPKKKFSIMHVNQILQEPQ